MEPGAALRGAVEQETAQDVQPKWRAHEIDRSMVAGVTLNGMFRCGEQRLCDTPAEHASKSIGPSIPLMAAVTIDSSINFEQTKAVG
jgi:hypothetical protein